MRVQDPARLAELLLAEDKGWSPDKVRELLANGNNTEVQLQRQIPVHVTYFTAVGGEDGQVNYLADPYGHDNRVLAALGGKSLPADHWATAATASTGRRAGRRNTSRRATTFSPGCSGTDRCRVCPCEAAAAGI